MDKIADAVAIANLPVAELAEELEAFLKPVAEQLPDERLRRVLVQAVQGIVGAQSPVVTEVARGVEREQEHAWPVAKRIYRFLANGRFSHRQVLRGLVAIANRAVAGALGALPAPVVCYAHWFSYRAKDFRSENRELWQASRVRPPGEPPQPAGRGGSPAWTAGRRSPWRIW